MARKLCATYEALGSTEGHILDVAKSLRKKCDNEKQKSHRIIEERKFTESRFEFRRCKRPAPGSEPLHSSSNASIVVKVSILLNGKVKIELGV